MTGNEATADQVPGSSPRLSPEDQSVIDAIASGAYQDALQLCAEFHGQAVGRLCMALLGSQNEAEDIAQDTLLDAYAGFVRRGPTTSVRAWLCAIARRKCARHMERRGRREARLRLIHDSARSPATDELVARRQRAEQAREAIGSIRPTEREALLLRYSAELSFEDVGQACGIDAAAARKRVSRALGRLRASLGAKE